MRISTVGCRLGFVAALVASLPSLHAATSFITIVPTFDSTITSDTNSGAIEAAINQAITNFDSVVTTPNPITVNITFGEGGGLGQSTTTLFKISYSSFLTALEANSSADATDLAAIAANDGSATNNPVTGSAFINVKTANLKALGLCTGSCASVATDGSILLNTTLTTPGSPGTTGQYELTVVAEHEIDEVLGLGSDLGQSNSFFDDPAPEDLFRYFGGVRSYTTNTAAQAFFSIDGTTNLAEFDNQGDGGDWGDWRSGATPKVQDAFGTPGANPALGVELTALDAIGYNLNPVPEPATFVMGGVALLGVFLLRRRTAR